MRALDIRIHLLFVAFLLMYLEYVTGQTSHVGREFIIGFPENRFLSTYPVIRVHVTSLSDLPIQVECSLPLHDPNNINTYILNPRESITQDYPVEMHISGSGPGTKGVQILSSGDITVQAGSVNDLSTDSFLALPTHVLGSTYYVMTYLYRGNSTGHAQGPTEFAIIGVFDNTEVTISFPDGAMNPYNHRTKTMQVYLDRYTTFQVQSDLDLVGTYVDSSRPVSVLCGTVWTSVSAEFMGDHLVEQLMPTSSWGQEFVTAPIITRTGGDVLRILAKESHTGVQFLDESVPNTISLIITLNEGEFWDFDASSTSPYHIISNKPVLVAQFCKSHGADNTRRSDPFMTFIPHVAQWMNAYSFATLEPYSSLDAFDHYANVFSYEAETPLIRLDDEEIEPSLFVRNWTDFNHMAYSYATIRLSPGRHLLSIDGVNKSFGGILYGLKFQESYGHPLGMTLEGRTTKCVRLRMSPNDGFDNDCDGMVDEEIENGQDDDEDGLVDEDLKIIETTAVEVETTTIEKTTTIITTPQETTTEAYTTTPIVEQPTSVLTTMHPEYSTKRSGGDLSYTTGFKFRITSPALDEHITSDGGDLDKTQATTKSMWWKMFSSHTAAISSDSGNVQQTMTNTDIATSSKVHGGTTEYHQTTTVSSSKDNDMMSTTGKFMDHGRSYKLIMPDITTTISFDKWWKLYGVAQTTTEDEHFGQSATERQPASTTMSREKWLEIYGKHVRSETDIYATGTPTYQQTKTTTHKSTVLNKTRRSTFTSEAAMTTKGSTTETHYHMDQSTGGSYDGTSSGVVQTTSGIVIYTTTGDNIPTTPLHNGNESRMSTDIVQENTTYQNKGKLNDQETTEISHIHDTASTANGNLDNGVNSSFGISWIHSNSSENISVNFLEGNWSMSTNDSTNITSPVIHETNTTPGLSNDKSGLTLESLLLITIPLVILFGLPLILCCLFLFCSCCSAKKKKTVTSVEKPKSDFRQKHKVQPGIFCTVEYQKAKLYDSKSHDVESVKGIQKQNLHDWKGLNLYTSSLVPVSDFPENTPRINALSLNSSENQCTKQKTQTTEVCQSPGDSDGYRRKTRQEDNCLETINSPPELCKPLPVHGNDKTTIESTNDLAEYATQKSNCNRKRRKPKRPEKWAYNPSELPGMDEDVDQDDGDEQECDTIDQVVPYVCQTTTRETHHQQQHTTSAHCINEILEKISSVQFMHTSLQRNTDNADHLTSSFLPHLKANYSNFLKSSPSETSKSEVPSELGHKADSQPVNTSTHTTRCSYPTEQPDPRIYASNKHKESGNTIISLPFDRHRKLDI